MDVVITINMKKKYNFLHLSGRVPVTHVQVEIEKFCKFFFICLFFALFLKKNVASCAMGTRADTSEKIV